jgi:hypothetical protein
MFKSDFWKLVESFLKFLQQLLIAHWRSLLVLLIGVYLPLQVFGELAEEVWENEGGFPWDVPILLAIHLTAQPRLDVFAATLTKFGVFWGVFPLSAVIVLVLLRQRQWRSLAYLISTLLGSIIINRTAKVLLHRVRPHLWESPSPELDYGFPKWSCDVEYDTGGSFDNFDLGDALVLVGSDCRGFVRVGYWLDAVIPGGSLSLVIFSQAGWFRSPGQLG